MIAMDIDATVIKVELEGPLALVGHKEQARIIALDQHY